MAHSIPQFFIILTTLLITFSSSLSKILPTSTISAAPALLPNPITPSSSPPALSPDITPLFPTPGGSELSPSDSSLPIIPSSPSPPNPDTIAASGPGLALAPSGLLPDSSSLRLSVPGFLSSMVVSGFVVFGLMIKVYG